MAGLQRKDAAEMVLGFGELEQILLRLQSISAMFPSSPGRLPAGRAGRGEELIGEGPHHGELVQPAASGQPNRAESKASGCSADEAAGEFHGGLRIAVSASVAESHNPSEMSQSRGQALLSGGERGQCVAYAP